MPLGAMRRNVETSPVGTTAASARSSTALPRVTASAAHSVVSSRWASGRASGRVTQTRSVPATVTGVNVASGSGAPGSSAVPPRTAPPSSIPPICGVSETRTPAIVSSRLSGPDASRATRRRSGSSTRSASVRAGRPDRREHAERARVVGGHRGDDSVDRPRRAAGREGQVDEVAALLGEARRRGRAGEVDRERAQEADVLGASGARARPATRAGQGEPDDDVAVGGGRPARVDGGLHGRRHVDVLGEPGRCGTRAEEHPRARRRAARGRPVACSS